MARILITGGLGLIGHGLATALEASGSSVDIMDIRGSSADGTCGDIANLAELRARIEACEGIVHLAAVSRVVWGERDPVRCWQTNVDGLRNVLRVVAEQPVRRRPWVVLSSSREVYGQPDRLPVHEDAPLKPMNVYARSKVGAEGLMHEARRSGITTAIARLSNVYGSTSDHPDRVVPAFARAAAAGGTMRIEGAGNLLDFTWCDDVCTGLATLCAMLAQEKSSPPPIHFVSGRGTQLLELARLARAAGKSADKAEICEPRSYDVSSFRGDPSRAKEVLGWSATTSLEEGMLRLVAAFRCESAVGASVQPSAASLPGG